MAHPTPPLPFPTRASDAHKGDFGSVLLIGGSRGMAGSIALSSMAALKTGSGLVSAAVPDRCLETVASFHPGIMTLPLPDTDDGQFASSATLPSTQSLNAVGCGPGMRTGAGSLRIVEALLQQNDCMRLMDADAINLLSEHQLLDRPALPRDQSTLVLTPHPGELARLTGVSAGDRPGQIAAAKTLVEKHGLTIVVKGGPTVVVGLESAADNRNVIEHVNNSGNPGMATAGSGDVLTGIITSLLGQGLSPWDAARLGVFVHGLAGDAAAAKHSQPGMTCAELLQSLPDVIHSL
ncbi:ATP-dependent (S)-NAD(P)H-hydrate dehydratase [Stieleria maiorica]|uniref:ADP-dependent (S)-NAD(P)H-hydrate dehydratase n=1 Tax=Stieleria maiorica TaxID=2795974 RepID=A0A5B9M960_9BACT|nr:NAD(P)H-hydrate dehydratase [Stieleria maiorica]QEF96726.1 ATP-dependent (S)-NAD(P)H-hydrate dehydratase [Stieleria maiorica]